MTRTIAPTPQLRPSMLPPGDGNGDKVFFPCQMQKPTNFAIVDALFDIHVALQGTMTMIRAGICSSACKPVIGFRAYTKVFKVCAATL